jgi:hypothetical protein
MDDDLKRSPAGIGRIAALFFLRFLAASVPLYLLYVVAGIHYMRLVAYLSKPLFRLFDIELVMQRALTVTEEISLNPVVFISLVLATTGVRASRKIRGGILGFVILTLANSITLFMMFLSASRGSERLWSSTEFFNLTINFFLPILLWIVLLPIVSLASGLREPRGSI